MYTSHPVSQCFVAQIVCLLCAVCHTYYQPYLSMSVGLVDGSLLAVLQILSIVGMFLRIIVQTPETRAFSMAVALDYLCLVLLFSSLVVVGYGMYDSKSIPHAFCATVPNAQPCCHQQQPAAAASMAKGSNETCAWLL